MELVESLKICILMWDWLADHPIDTKSDAIIECNINIDLENDCACCAYNVPLSPDDCDNCPLVGLWGVDKCYHGGLFSQFESLYEGLDPHNEVEFLKNYNTMKELAKCIANLARLRLKDFTY